MSCRQWNLKSPAPAKVLPLLVPGILNLFTYGCVCQVKSNICMAARHLAALYDIRLFGAVVTLCNATQAYDGLSKNLTRLPATGPYQSTIWSNFKLRRYPSSGLFARLRARIASVEFRLPAGDSRWSQPRPDDHTTPRATFYGQARALTRAAFRGRTTTPRHRQCRHSWAACWRGAARTRTCRRHSRAASRSAAR